MQSIRCEVHARFSTRDLLTHSSPVVVSSVNIEILVQMHQNRSLLKSFCGFRYNLVDGQWTKLYFLLTKGKRTLKYSGSDLYGAILAELKPDDAVLVLGGSKDVNDQAQKNLKKQFPTLRFFGSSEYIRNQADVTPVVQFIQDHGIRYVMVCLGAPKQEMVAQRLSMDLAGPVIIQCAGGTVDFIAGAIRRAPRFIQIFGLEWFWRLCQEPKMRFKRLWKASVYMLRRIRKVHESVDVV